VSDKGLSSADPSVKDSPFLDTEFHARETVEELEPLSDKLTAESPFLQLNPAAFEQEIIGKDDRVLVTDTLKRPNRWICAIDILTENPKWGKSTSEPKLISKSRGTGILIGPRYVLTARHILDKQTIDDGGRERSVAVKELTLSPARNGSNSQNPLGKVKSKTVRVSQPYFIRRKVKVDSKEIEVPIKQHDDYALIILEKDLASLTHSKMNGALGYWGHDSTAAVVRRLDPDKITDKEIVVIGYPGDCCGKDKFSGSSSEKTRKIENCWLRRNDQWASTQWKGAGRAEVEENSTTIFHSSDTYRGQSGAPICLTVDSTLTLAGIHTESHDSQRNRGVRVTRRMLRELCAWMNDDAGYTIATIKNDALTVQARTSAGEQELMDDFTETEAGPLEGFTENTFDEFNPYGGAEYEEVSSEETVPQEQFDPSSVPNDVKEALARKDWPLALELAIQAGWRDENELTNLIFFAGHLELPVEKLDSKDPRFKQLSHEWTKINEDEVWKAIEKSAKNIDLVVGGDEVTDHHRRFFRRKSGKRLKKLVEDAAREVDLNPGLLGTVMMAETRRPLSYLSNGKVSSYHIGTDDFYEGRFAIKKRVPAYAKVRWDKAQKPVEELNDAKTNPRLVKTILFDSGSDAVLATAVYLKFREVRLREIAAESNEDFDSLPLATRIGLTRIAMTAGTGGATPYLKDALQGKDIFDRRNIPVKEYQTKRNATVRTAQAMHLSDWVFGLPVPAATTPLPKMQESENLDEMHGMWVDEGTDEFVAIVREKADQEKDSKLIQRDIRDLFSAEASVEASV